MKWLQLSFIVFLVSYCQFICIKYIFFVLQTPVIVDQLWSDDDEVTAVGPGENVKVKLKGIEEEDVSPGFVLCDSSNPTKTGRIFDAQVVILEHKSIICAGYSAVMHIHCVAEEVTVKVIKIFNAKILWPGLNSA